ncbi:MAG: hypothetical protein ABR499_01680 [Gemmatimonadaceae bacterium]
MSALAERARRVRRGIWIAARVLAAAQLAACADLKAVNDLAVELQARYPSLTNVAVNNRSHLVLTFDRAVVANLDSAGRKAFAFEAARFARTRFRGARPLEDVSVAFVERSARGPVTITRTERPYRWPLAELPPLIVEGGGRAR